MKKDWFVLFLAVIMTAAVTAGCGSSSDPEQDIQNAGFDEINVGEIYYRETDYEHIAETDEGFMYADNEILVVSVEGTLKSEIEVLADEYNAGIVGYIEQTGDYQWILPDTYTKDELEELCDELESEEIIYRASLNGIAEVSGSMLSQQHSGFYYGEEWQSDLQYADDGKGKSWGLEVINALTAWDELSDNEYTNPVKLGLIDIGFDTNHEDLNFAETFYNDSFDTNIENGEHGTHVAGTMAASTSDDTGICGVYPYGDGNLYGVAYGGSAGNGGFDSNEENGTFLTSVISQKIDYAELILRGVKVINQSQAFNVYFLLDFDYDEVLNFWNNYDFSDQEALAAELGDFLNRLLIKGYDFVIVTCAGNDSDPSIGHLESRYSLWANMISRDDYPDVYDRIIVVGAVNSDLEISSYSNGGDRTDIYAPGGENAFVFKSGTMIYSTVPDDGYGYLTGTSQAAPHVSGTAACVWAANNDLTGAEVKRIVCSSTNPDCTSYKLVDAGVAVQKAIDLISEDILWNTEAGETDETDESEEEEPEYGSIMGYVADLYDDDIKIEGAAVTATNTQTGETITEYSDSSGHFEIILPEGLYTLHAVAEHYFDYDMKDDEKYVVTISKSGEVSYPNEWILMRPDKISGTKYYDSDGKLIYFERYSYYDNWNLCSSTVYAVNYYSDDDYYLSEEYTFLYLYDEDGELCDTVFGSLTISDWYNESTGELILDYDFGEDGSYVKKSIYPEEESIGQEKFGVDPSKTEKVYDKFQRIGTDVSSGWADEYLDSIFSDADAPTDQTFCRLMYVDDDLEPEIWIDYGYGAAGGEIYSAGGSSIYLSHGSAQWVEKENLLYVSGGHMGYYYDEILEIDDDGEFSVIDYGEYEISYVNGEMQLDENDEEIYIYCWNGEEVTESEYIENLKNAFDSTKAEYIYQNIYTYDQCRLMLESLL